MATIFDKLLNVDGRRLKQTEKKIKPVLALEQKYAAMSNEELQAETPRLKQLLAEGKTLDDIRPEAFATAREACRRVIGEFPYPVQLMGAAVMQGGDIANVIPQEATLAGTMRTLSDEVRAAAKELEFERAAEYRDRIKALRERLYVSGE